MDIFTGFVPIPIQKMRNKIHLQHKTSSVQHQKSLTQNPLPSGKPPFSYDFPMIFLWFSRKYHGKNIPTPHVSSVSGRRTQEKPRSARIALTGLRELRSATRSHPKKTDINIKHIKKHTYIYIYNYIYISYCYQTYQVPFPKKKVSNKNPPSRPNQRQSPTVTLGAQTHRPRNWLSIRRDS